MELDGSDAQLMSEVTQRESEVKALLAKKDKKGALAKALQNPPIGAKAEQVKVTDF